MLMVLQGCGCSQTGQKLFPSPDREYVAIETETNCGATDPFATEVVIRSGKPRLNIERLGYPQKRVFLADVGISSTQVTWLDKRKLEIRCTGCEKYGIATRLSGWKDVEIIYVESSGNPEK